MSSLPNLAVILFCDENNPHQSFLSHGNGRFYSIPVLFFEDGIAPK
ncbi:MAG: hypothetical protein AAF611_04690 [Bacteroidota bacterium]